MAGTTQARATREARAALTAAGLSASVRKITSCLSGPGETHGTCTLVDVAGGDDTAPIRQVLGGLPRTTRVFGDSSCIIVARDQEA